LNRIPTPVLPLAPDGRAAVWLAPLRVLLSGAGPLLGLLFVTSVFALSAEVRPYFYTGANFKIILTQSVVVAVGALGMTLIIVSGGIDLSVGAVVALCSVIGARLLVAGHPPAMVVAATLAAGGLVGLVNGGIIAGFRLLPFIVTLGMMGVARGAAKWLAGNQAINPPENPVNAIMAQVEPTTLFPLPWGVWLVVLLAVLISLVLERTVFGTRVFALGSNEATARLCGIRVPLQKLLIYGVAGLFFGLAGLLQLSRLTQGDPTVAIGLELDIIAAVVIGGASLSGGSGSIHGSMIGALIMAVLRNGSNQMGWPTYVQEILIGVVIVVAVGLDKLRRIQSRL
jgi:ribose transport system permease protein